MPVRLNEQLTPRIRLRSAQPEDAFGLFALIEADRDYLDEWIPRVGAIRSADEMESVIEVVDVHWMLAGHAVFSARKPGSG